MTATMPRPATGSDEIRVEYGVPQIFALKFVTGKSVTSRYPGGRVMFTSVDRGPLFLNDEDAGDLETRLRELRVEPGELIQVLKVKMPHGGGHAIRVSRVSDAAEPVSQLETQLAKSLEMVQARSSAPAPVAPPPPRYSEATQPQSLPSNAITPASAKLLAAYMLAVDTLLETQVYARRKGLELGITTEDCRCLAATILIDQQKGGR